MADKTDSLAKVQTYISIASAIAIPIVIALVGWWVQSSISSEGLKKDYVQMAIGILRDADKQKDVDLREWAVSVLEHHSPVPFGPGLRAKFFKGVFLPFGGFPAPPPQFMEPAEALLPLPTDTPVTNQVLLLNVIENYGRCSMNRAKLEAFQEWARGMQKIGEDSSRVFRKPGETGKK
jgi:hypothetical protein